MTNSMKNFPTQKLTADISRQSAPDLVAVNEKLMELTEKLKDKNPEAVAEALRLVGKYHDIATFEESLESFKYLEKEVKLNGRSIEIDPEVLAGHSSFVLKDNPGRQHLYIDNKSVLDKEGALHISRRLVHGESFIKVQGADKVDRIFLKGKEIIHPKGTLTFKILQNGEAGQLILLATDKSAKSHAYLNGKWVTPPDGYIQITKPKESTGKIYFEAIDENDQRHYYLDGKEIILKPGHKRHYKVDVIAGHSFLTASDNDGNLHVYIDGQEFNTPKPISSLLGPIDRGGKIYFNFIFNDEKVVHIFYGDKEITPPEGCVTPNKNYDVGENVAYITETIDRKLGRRHHVFVGQKEYTPPNGYEEITEIHDLNGLPVFDVVDDHHNRIIIHGKKEVLTLGIEYEIIKVKVINGQIVTVVKKSLGPRKGMHDIYINNEKINNDDCCQVNYFQMQTLAGEIVFTARDQVGNDHLYYGKKELSANREFQHVTIDDGKIVEYKGKVAYTAKTLDDKWHVFVGDQEITDPSGHEELKDLIATKNHLEYWVVDEQGKQHLYYDDKEVTPILGCDHLFTSQEMAEMGVFYTASNDGTWQVFYKGKQLSLRNNGIDQKPVVHNIAGKVVISVRDYQNNNFHVFINDKLVTPQLGCWKVGEPIEVSGHVIFDYLDGTGKHLLLDGVDIIPDGCDDIEYIDNIFPGELSLIAYKNNGHSIIYIKGKKIDVDKQYKKFEAFKVINGKVFFMAKGDDEECLMNEDGEQCSQEFDEIYHFEHIKNNFVKVIALLDDKIVTRVIDITDWERLMMQPAE